jgi:hypothetical protein
MRTKPLKFSKSLALWALKGNNKSHLSRHNNRMRSPPAASLDSSGTNTVKTGPSFFDSAQKVERRTPLEAKSRPSRHCQNPAVFILFANNLNTNGRLSSRMGCLKWMLGLPRESLGHPEWRLLHLKRRHIPIRSREF